MLHARLAGLWGRGKDALSAAISESSRQARPAGRQAIGKRRCHVARALVGATAAKGGKHRGPIRKATLRLEKSGLYNVGGRGGLLFMCSRRTRVGTRGRLRCGRAGLPAADSAMNHLVGAVVW